VVIFLGNGSLTSYPSSYRNIELILRGFVALCEKKRIEVNLWVMVTPLVKYHTKTRSHEGNAINLMALRWSVGTSAMGYPTSLY